jgi:hypothetical protein
LSYMGHVLDAASKRFVSLPGDVAFEKLRAIMIKMLPQIGRCMLWNVRKRKSHKSRKVMLVGEIVRSKCTMRLLTNRSCFEIVMSFV